MKNTNKIGSLGTRMFVMASSALACAYIPNMTAPKVKQSHGSAARQAKLRRKNKR